MHSSFGICWDRIPNMQYCKSLCNNMHSIKIIRGAAIKATIVDTQCITKSKRKETTA